jgi:hypothetical protein
MLDALADPEHPDHAEAAEYLEGWDLKEINELPLKIVLGRIADRRSAARTRIARKGADHGALAARVSVVAFRRMDTTRAELDAQIRSILKTFGLIVGSETAALSIRRAEELAAVHPAMANLVPSWPSCNGRSSCTSLRSTATYAVRSEVIRSSSA